MPFSQLIPKIVHDVLKCRWSDALSSDRLNSSHFRKSSQWVSLIRKHAELAVKDTHLSAIFERLLSNLF